MRSWTLGRKVGVGFAVMIALVALVALVAWLGARSALLAQDELQRHFEGSTAVKEVEARVWQEAGAFHDYLLLENPQTLITIKEARQRLAEDRRRIPALLTTAEGLERFEQVAHANDEWLSAVERLLVNRGTASPAQLEAAYRRDVYPLFQEITAAIDDFERYKEMRIDEARERAESATHWATTLSAALVAVALFVGIVLAILITRGVAEAVSAAIGQVQSSASELQAASKQQATSAREQATATAEVTSTLKELVVTSRQIADSAKQVAQLADETAGEASSAEDVVEQAQQSMAVIQRQVDAVVEHMLELGRKSQRAGGILDIINELAEQTNILAINATIESAGAGEAGRRFLVVAEEIRKLADRVGESSREIRAVIEDMRAAANTTVMATEEGAKSVDLGSRRVREMAASFKKIVGLVETTTEATQEIELSTKQQTSAVEQVNSALEDVAQAARETETAAKQALEMSSQMTRLSRQLSRMVRPENE